MPKVELASTTPLAKPLDVQDSKAAPDTAPPELLTAASPLDAPSALKPRLGRGGVSPIPGPGTLRFRPAPKPQPLPPDLTEAANVGANAFPPSPTTAVPSSFARRSSPASGVHFGATPPTRRGRAGSTSTT